MIGAALARARREKQGIAELECAERDAVRAGRSREADAAARELRRLGQPRATPARGASPRGSTMEALSAREQEVAALVAAGKRNRDVARRCS